MMNQLDNIMSKVETQVMNKTELYGVTQKSVLKQEETVLQAELKTFEEKLTDFDRGKLETVDRIHTKIKRPSRGGDFFTSHAPYKIYPRG